MKPVFLLSLPRAGSTLLQRLLMTHPAIETCGEPWLALPLAKMFAKDESFSTYGHASLVRSGEHLSQQLPNGKDDLLEASGHFLSEIYGKLASEGATYFLDKTPRYYKIVPELIKMMPDARFIILRREPVAVFASMLNYIGGRMHLLPTWEQDILEGVPGIARAMKLLAGRAHVVDYESLVLDPEGTLAGLLAFLELDPEGCSIDALDSTHVARGDQTGARKYAEVSQASLDGWKATLNSSVRKRIALKWLQRVDAADYLGYGYEKTDQISKVRSLAAPLRLKEEVAWLTGRVYFNYQFNVIRWGHARRRDGLSCNIY